MFGKKKKGDQGKTDAAQPAISNFRIEYAIRRHMPAIYAIENESFADPWNEQEFTDRLLQRNCIGQVATVDADGIESVCGFVVYELHPDRIEIANLAVASVVRRQQVGHLIMAKLKGKLSTNRRSKLIMRLTETNFPGLKFLQFEKFVCEGIERQFFDNGEDAYRMVYRLRPKLSALSIAANRISQLETAN